MLYARSVASGMFNGCAFFTKLRAKTGLTVRIVQLNLEYRVLLKTEIEPQESEEV